MKPDIVEVLEILQMKAEAKQLYEKIDARVAAINHSTGQGRYDYDLDTLPEQDEESHISEIVKELRENGQFFKFEIEDNLEKLYAGESVFKSVSMKPVSFSARSLKRKPKTL